MKKPESTTAGTIGANLRAQRESLSMTQAQVARGLDLSGNFIGLIERGARLPSLGTLERWCAVLSIRMGAVFEEGGHGKKGGPGRRKKALLAQLEKEDEATLLAVLDLLRKSRGRG